jgi:hypothetical protein
MDIIDVATIPLPDSDVGLSFISSVSSEFSDGNEMLVRMNSSSKTCWKTPCGRTID